MNITPKVIAIIKQYLLDNNKTGLSPADVASFLNAPTIQNKSPQKNIQPPFTFSSLASVIDPVSLGNVINYIHLDVVISDIRGQDRDAALLWSKGLTAAGIITKTDMDALMGVLTLTVPDPAYKNTLSFVEDQFGLGLEITDEEVFDNKLNA